jgi:hypothetical protein
MSSIRAIAASRFVDDPLHHLHHAQFSGVEPQYIKGSRVTDADTLAVAERIFTELNSRVAAAFEAAGVVTMVGDWTVRDEAITRFLTAKGAAGVPLYLWYPARSTDAEQLPQVLTPEMLIQRARADRSAGHGRSRATASADRSD